MKPWKLVGDNLDVTVKVRDMRMDNPNQMHHFFHLIAIQDRVDTSHLDNSAPKADVRSLRVADFVPSDTDLRQLKGDLIILVSRIIVTEFPEFSFMQGAVPHHIAHAHSQEMSHQSSVVCHANVILLIFYRLAQV